MSYLRHKWNKFVKEVHQYGTDEAIKLVDFYGSEIDKLGCNCTLSIKERKQAYRKKWMEYMKDYPRKEGQSDDGKNTN